MRLRRRWKAASVCLTLRRLSRIAFFDVGIAEAHAVTFAAGLAAAQMKPYVAIYSSFLQRSYDNILHDVALQNLPVRFLVDRASLAGGDGPTHHGIFDVSFLSSIPNLHIFAPATFASLDRFLAASADASVPLAIRYPNAGENPRVLERFFEKDGTQTVAHADFFLIRRTMPPLLLRMEKL